MNIKKSSFLKEWRKINLNALSRMYPEVDPKDIKKFLNEQIEKNLVNPDCEIHNNYIHKSIKSNLLEVIDWIRTTNPICGGHGVFYKNQNEITNALSQMILKFLTSRKKFKGQLRFIKDKNSYEYKTYDRKQLSEKIMANSIYGSLGNVMSFIYNAYTAPSVTGTGQSLISTTCTAFEAFMANNIAFNNINECITYLDNIMSEKHSMDDSFCIDVSMDDVFHHLVDMFYDYKPEYGDVLIDYIYSLPQNMLNRIYYKNNLYEFSKHPEILELLENIVLNTEEFKDPNKLPEQIVPYLNKLWSYYNEFVLYNHFAFNRIQRLKNDKRKCVLTIDTDSNMLDLNPWVEFMSENVINQNEELRCRDTDQLRFISINTMAFVITNMIGTVLGKYTKGANIPKEYRGYINMKNEFLFSRMVLASKKKKYITSVRLREGDEIYPEKLDVKGFEFMKSSATEDTKQYFLNIIRKELIENQGDINIPSILRRLENLEEEILDSLKNGDKKYLTPKSVKEANAYKDGHALREQGFRGICIWNYLYPDMPIELPAKIDIVKVTLDNERNLNKLKEINSDIYNKIMKHIVNNINPDISSKLVPVIAIPRNVDKIPDWIIPFIDYDTITVDVLKKFYPVLESLGLQIIKTAKKEYYSNIINI